MIAPEIAWQELAAHLAGRSAGAGERVARAAALGRRLVGPVVATTDLPSADISALDGFAFAADPGGPGAVRSFRVAGTTLAGAPGEGPPLAADAAWRIMTGAPLPPGADRVVGFEDLEVAGDAVRAKSGLAAVAPGAAVRRRGEVLGAGAPLLEAGATLRPAALALLASQGIEEVQVAALPRVEVVVTGDEVRRGSAIRPGEVRDSHSDFLAGELARLGIAPATGEPVRDDASALEERLRRALERSDVVLTCGGVSMGDADLVPGALERLGCRQLFHGVAVQPGKPLLAAVRDATLVFGLPGNPGSVMTSFWLFVKPVLRQLAGAGDGPSGTAFWSGALAVELTAALGAGRGRDRFVPARLAAREGGLEATPLPPKGSHDLVAFAGANALLRIRPGDAARAAGDGCEAIWID